VKKYTHFLFWIELALAGLSALLCLLTIVSPEWIEELFGLDPDRGTGSFEWELVVLSGFLTFLFALLAGRQWSATRVRHESSKE
jgi:hypothetical protein